MESDLVLQGSTSPVLEEIKNIPGAWVIHNLITAEEAEYFISKIEFDEEIDTSTRLRLDDDYQASIKRKSFRHKKDYPYLAKQVFDRLQGVIPQTLCFDKEDEELGPFLAGTWDFHCVNERVSFLKYGPGGVFSKHRDGIFVKNEDLRSLMTVLVYLNNQYEGGKTKCYDDSEAFEAEIEPVVGDAFLMVQRVLHEGGTVISGFKYAIRFDLMFYKRTGKTDEEISKNELAEKYLAMANELERSFQGKEAVKYYQLAFKLNPKLEEIL